MLASLLTPDWTAGTTLAHLPLQRLLERPEGPIRALVLDVDRTLLPRRSSTLPPSAERWLRHAAGLMPLHLLSNNPSRQRIGRVAQQLDVPYTTSAAKPRRAALRRVVADLGLLPHQVALVGDRLFTDVLAGNRLGLYTVLVRPIAASGDPCSHDTVQSLEIRMSRWLGALV
jgi:HAD superfamily phosphatase (TIGR01668 family)